MGANVDNSNTSQTIAGSLSMVLSTVIMVVTFWWAAHKSTGHNLNDGWLGKLSSNKCTQHAALMILAMCFCQSWAIVAYRVFRSFGHDISKAIHGFWHTSAFGIMIAAVALIIEFHNDKQWGHLATLHSWVGILCFGLYFCNYFSGLITFGFQLVPQNMRGQAVPYHRFLGVAAFFLASVAMMTGILQKDWLDGASCFYIFDNSDKSKINPANGYYDIPIGCRVSHGLGIMIAINCVLVLYTIWDFPPVESHTEIEKVEMIRGAEKKV